jgi:hypothetical protein
VVAACDWWPHKSFDNYHNQALAFRWAVYELIYRLTVCYPKLYFFKICSNFQIHDKKTYNMHSPWNLFLFAKKNSSLLLLHLNKCKLSYLLVIDASTLDQSVIPHGRSHPLWFMPFKATTFTTIIVVYHLQLCVAIILCC